MRSTGGLDLTHLLGDGAGGRLAAPTARRSCWWPLSLFVVALAENARIPVDDPTTHLELTMIHEVMVLDHSGPDLALIQYGAALKLYLFGALVVKLVLGARLADPAGRLRRLRRPGSWSSRWRSAWSSRPWPGSGWCGSRSSSSAPRSSPASRWSCS